MPTVHFLNVLEGDCNIIQHDSGRVSVIDVSNAYNEKDTPEELAVKNSEMREIMRTRTFVPSDKRNYKQKETPDNPINYLRQINVKDIFRFIVTHPDMDHLDGIKDLFAEFPVYNVWDTDNNKTIEKSSFFAGYNWDDWKFYTDIRSGSYSSANRKTYFGGNSYQFFNEDDLHILCPTPTLIKQANEDGDMHDASYVLLFTPPKKNGGTWKILLAGDSHDNSWEYILNNHRELVTNVDVLLAPHHGRDSKRNYNFLEVLKPKVTLFGNASHEHLAYTCYNPLRITNNQAGYIIMDITLDRITFYVKNWDFARDFAAGRGWPIPEFHKGFQAWGLIAFT